MNRRNSKKKSRPVEYVKIESEKISQYVKLVESCEEDENWKECARLSYLVAKEYDKKSDFNGVLQHLLRALYYNLKGELRHYRDLSIFNKAVKRLNLRDFYESLEYFKEISLMGIKSEKLRYIADLYLSIGDLFLRQNYSEKAKELFYKARSIYEINKNWKKVSLLDKKIKPLNL